MNIFYLNRLLDGPSASYTASNDSFMTDIKTLSEKYHQEEGPDKSYPPS